MAPDSAAPPHPTPFLVSPRTLLLRWPDQIDRNLTREILWTRDQLRARFPLEIAEGVPTYSSLALYLHSASSVGRIVGAISSLPPLEKAPSLPPRLIPLPVCYEEPYGPDLAAVAARHGWAPEEVVRRHSGIRYPVFFLGFLPGFAYLGGMDPRLATPRRSEPRTRVEAGSVGIAGLQTGVYPSASPGGWNILGRTPVSLFRAEAHQPARLQPGDEVVFEPIDAPTFRRIAHEQGSVLPPLDPLAGHPQSAVARVLRPGMLTTLQDAGRYGFRDQGVPLSGGMDRTLAELGNACLNNPAGAPVLEFTVVGPELEGLEDLTLALATEGFEATVGGRPIRPFRPFRLRAGERLRVGRGQSALRGYLAVEGGWAGSPVLGSASAYPPLTPSLGIDRGTLLHRRPQADPLAGLRVGAVRPPIDLSYLEEEVLEAWPGPEWSALGRDVQQAIRTSSFSVHPDSNRMAVFLDHSAPLTAREILTGPVQPGIVQLTPSGRVIVLMRDAQTTGGYARILQLSERALNTLAQRRPRSRVEFRVGSPLPLR